MAKRFTNNKIASYVANAIWDNVNHNPSGLFSMAWSEKNKVVIKTLKGNILVRFDVHATTEEELT